MKYVVQNFDQIRMIDPYPYTETQVKEIKGLTYGNKPSLEEVYNILKEIKINQMQFVIDDSKAKMVITKNLQRKQTLMRCQHKSSK